MLILPASALNSLNSLASHWTGEPNLTKDSIFGLGIDLVTNLSVVPKVLFFIFLILQVQKEFGSFSNYCWRFVNHNPIRNGFRYARQIPAKTPKSELISKDLMQRGFRCVGPTVVYSFMQVSGMVNDHLLSCPKYHECNNKPAKTDSNSKFEEKTELQAEAVESRSVSNDWITWG